MQSQNCVEISTSHLTVLLQTYNQEEIQIDKLNRVTEQEYWGVINCRHDFI